MKKCFDLKNNKKRLGLLGAFAFLMGFIFGFSFINGSSFADEDLINFEETIFTGEETENLANIEEDIKDEEISGEELFEKVEEGEDVTKNLEEPGLKLGVFVENMEEIQENIQDDNHHYTIMDQKNPDGTEFTWENITICDPNNSKACITLMDRNLGATKAGTTCSSTDNGACGYHYQRGNNYGFKNSGKNGTDEIGDMATFTKATWDDRFDNNGYFGTSFVQELYSATYNYRLDGENHDGVRGGAGDSESNNRGYDIVGNIAIDVSDRQGPCPDGYHVPSAGELGTLVKYWRDTYATGVTLNGNNNLFYFSDNTARPKFQEYFKIPFAGWRHFNYANIDNVNYYATLWTSSPISTITRNFYMNSSDVNSDDSSPRTLAYSLRCFKNYAEVESNTFTVSFDSNGGTEIEDIDVSENEIFTKPEDPIKTGFTFSGWYLSGMKTLRNFDNNVVTGDMILYANWEENSESYTSNYTIMDQKNPDGSEFVREDITICDPNDEDVCITLMDRNLGATKAGTACSQSDNGACGYHYQRGNNYGFESCYYNGCSSIYGPNQISGSRISCSSYNPNNSFSSNVFIYAYNYNFTDYCIDKNDNLWGGVGDSNSNNRGYDITGNVATNVTNRQGPCPEGYHIPSAGELLLLTNMYGGQNIGNSFNNMKFYTDLKIPFAGDRDHATTKISYIGNNANIWASSPNNDGARYLYSNIQGDVLISSSYNHRTYGFSVRCFKDVTELNKEEFTISFNSNEGTNIEDIDVMNGQKITKPKDPIKTGFIFSGWYLSGTETLRDFDNNIVTGDMVLYANWEEIDIVRPICLVEYNPIILTQGDVIAVLTGCSEEITGTNLIYTFTGNGNYTFEYKDLAGNTGSTLATVNWIDREKPVCSVEYNPSTSTQQEVIATLTGCSEEIIGTNLTYTFTGNGNYTFEYKDLAGNTGSTLTIVNWIYKIGGTKLKKDSCPNGDNSDSYYDGICESTDNTYHKSADDKKNEYYEAYMFAYNNGIIDDNMVYDKSKDFINSNLTRIEMARILTNYAINVLGLKPDEGRIVDFSDLGENFDSSDKNVISLSYQLGIMGINMPNNEYRPYDLVPRSEFVTAFSRMVYGIEDGEDVYYSTHMNYLKNKGIVRDTNPKIIESIGYVLLMLNRTDY